MQNKFRNLDFVALGVLRSIEYGNTTGHSFILSVHSFSIAWRSRYL